MVFCSVAMSENLQAMVSHRLLPVRAGGTASTPPASGCMRCPPMSSAGTMAAMARCATWGRGAAASNCTAMRRPMSACRSPAARSDCTESSGMRWP